MKKDKRFYLALVIFCLTGQVAWTVENMYFNVFIYKMFHASASEISLMVAASAIAATVTTLLIGALSDKVGKRKIFICGGYILWGISIWSFSLIRMDVISALVPATVSAASVGVSLTIIASGSIRRKFTNNMIMPIQAGTKSHMMMVIWSSKK